MTIPINTANDLEWFAALDESKRAYVLKLIQALQGALGVTFEGALCKARMLLASNCW